MRKLALPLSMITWIGIWAALKFGVQPPIPGQVMGLYMSITTVSILVFLVADQERFEAFLSPLVALLRENRLAAPRIVLCKNKTVRNCCKQLESFRKSRAARLSERIAGSRFLRYKL